MSSVNTNVGPRQGSADKSVTELFNSPSNSSSGPYTLPIAGNLHKTVLVEQKKKLMRKPMYPRLASKIEKAGFKYELSMEEIAYTQLEENAVTRTSTITTVVRQVSKGVEYLVWYSIEKGYDSAGQEVIGSGTYLQLGLDKDVEIKQIKNSEGIMTRLQLSNVTKDILTEQFTPNKLEELLQNNELSEKIQYSFTNNLGKSYGGFNAEEMIHLSSKELTARGQLGKAGEDLSVLYSELSSKDKLFLQNQASK